MPGKNEIVAAIRMEGGAEFRKEITSINKSISAQKSELALVTAEYEGQANSLEALTAKDRALNKILEEQKKKVAETEKALNAAKTAYEKHKTSITQLQTAYADQKHAAENAAQAYEEASEKLKKMTEEGKSSESAIEQQKEAISKLKENLDKQNKAMEQAKIDLERGQNAYKKLGNDVNDWQTKLNSAQGQLIRTNSEINKNAAYMDEAAKSADGCAESIDKFGKEVQSIKVDMEDANDASSTFAATFAGNIAAFAAEKGLGILKEGAQELGEVMLDAGKASAQLAASTGLSETSAKKYEAVMKRVKSENFGEDYTDVADAMREIIQIMGELDDGAMQEITEDAITLRDTFGMDVNESIRAVDVMMKTMQVDATQAFDLITTGAQRGLNRSDELVDNLSEYGQLWGQMGFSAEEAFGIMENGLDAGAYNLDKVNDFVKEFGISLADGRIGEHIKSFSGNTQELFKAWQKGNASTRDVFYSIVSDLENMTDKQEALTIASDVWSALGEDNSMQVLTALNDVNDAYGNVQGSMDRLKETKFSDLESAIGNLGSAIKDQILMPIADVAAPALTGLANGIADLLQADGEVIEESQIQKMVDGLVDANSQIEEAVEKAKTTMQSAESEADEVGVLGDRLIQLNSIEGKTISQKEEMSAIVERLSESMPELASAYDEETGSLSKSNAEIRNMITNTQNLMIARAKEAATQELVNQSLEAQIALSKAQEVETDLKNRISLLEEEKKLMEGMYSDVDMDPEVYDAKMLEFWKQKLDDCQISLEDYNAIVESGAYTYDAYFDRLFEVNSQLDELEENEKTAAAATKDAKENLSDIQTEMKDVDAAADSLSGKYKDQAKAAEENAKKTEENRTAAERAASVIKDAAKLIGSAVNDAKEQVTENSGEMQDAFKRTAETAQDGADAQKDAMQSMIDTYQSTVDEIKNDLQDKINPFEKFDTSKDKGEDTTVEQMTENLDSQIEAFENYAKNLEAVKDHVGKEISPEFMRYIENMGMDGANMLEHILQTYADEEPEKVRELNDKWMQAMDQTEGIAKATAANKTALQAATGELGSTAEDFSTLKNAIDTAAETAVEGWAKLPEGTRTALEEVIETAQECGVKIPDGLAEGILSGETTPEQALAKMNGTISGSFDAIAKMAQDNGVKVPKELQNGIEKGGTDAVNAYSELISLLAGKMPELKQAIKDGTENSGTKEAVQTEIEGAAEAVEGSSGKFQTAGEKLGESAGEGIAKGVGNKKNEISNAVQEALQADGIKAGNGFDGIGGSVAEAIASGVKGKSDLIAQAVVDAANSAMNAAKSMYQTYQAAGNESGKQYAEGVGAGAAATPGKIATVSAQAAAAASGTRAGFRAAGVNAAAGLAEGITANRSAAINAAANMAAATLAAAKARLDINSPSKAFRKEAGRQIPTGLAFGIKDRTNLATAAADEMSAKVLTRATAWITGYKKKKKVAAEDEKWFWSEVLKHVQKGTDAYNEATANMIAAGVSKTKTTGSGKKKKTTAKDTETYYSEIYTAAEKYLTKQETLADVSTKNQLAYWTAIQKQLQSGTTAWYNAESKIKALKEKIGTVSNMSTLLETYQNYFNMSEEAEVEYWDAVRRQYAEGTEERLKADEKYLDAKKTWTEKLKDLEDDYNDKVKEVNDNLKDELSNLDQKYNDSLADRKKAIEDAFGLFDAFESESDTGKTLLSNIKTQAAGYEDWMQQLEELSGKGILNNQLMEQLTEQGPEISAALHALNSLTEEELKEYNEAYLKKQELAQKQAEKDSEKLRAETEKQKKELQAKADQKTKELTDKLEEAKKDVNKTISDELKALAVSAKTIADDQTTKLVQALTGARKTELSGNESGVSGAYGTSDGASAATGAGTPAAAGTQEAQVSTGNEDKILKIINSGKEKKTLSAKDRKKHAALYNYIFDKYKRAATNDMYKKLAEELGVKVNRTVTSAQKNSILKKLKKKGYRSGGIAKDEWEWMDEDLATKGAEMIVRKSDNAILTRMKPGDEILNADVAANMAKWGKYNPDELIGTIARQQNIAAAYQETMATTAGMEKINRLMDSTSASGGTAGSGRLEKLLMQMTELLQEYLPNTQRIGAGQQIVLDTGTLVGETAGAIGSELAMRQRRRRSR